MFGTYFSKTPFTTLAGDEFEALFDIGFIVDYA